jgi:hypothetical protein
MQGNLKKGANRIAPFFFFRNPLIVQANVVSNIAIQLASR